MSAAALAQRLRAGAVPGLNQTERNGWNAGANAEPCRVKRAATEGETPAGTARTGGTGISAGVGTQDAESRPQQSDPYAIGASWRPLAAAYYWHHFTCKTCTAAGHGRGDRCTTGADLWASYEAASDAAHDTNARRIRT
jgi:hypothetical protein